MALHFTSLNSGSNGNCYYIGNDSEAILIDAGLSCREMEKRMKRLGLALEKVKAIFVSHEHTDHIKGIPVIAGKYKWPVYITEGTLRGWGAGLDATLCCSFRAYEPIRIGALTITPFFKAHDAADPHSFTISSEGLHIGVFTDIGAPCEHLIHHFSQCHAAFLESNYDEAMLDNGSYPIYLKNRIRNGQGHLSNRQALELFTSYRPASLSHLLLSHLSHNNNDPDLVRQMFSPHAGETKIIIASRYEETPVYTLEGTTTTASSGISAPISIAAPAMTLASATMLAPATTLASATMPATAEAATTAATPRPATSTPAAAANAPAPPVTTLAAPVTTLTPATPPPVTTLRPVGRGPGRSKTPPVSTQYTLF